MDYSVRPSPAPFPFPLGLPRSRKVILEIIHLLLYLWISLKSHQILVTFVGMWHVLRGIWGYQVKALDNIIWALELVWPLLWNLCFLTLLHFPHLIIICLRSGPISLVAVQWEWGVRTTSGAGTLSSSSLYHHHNKSCRCFSWGVASCGDETIE